MGDASDTSEESLGIQARMFRAMPAHARLESMEGMTLFVLGLADADVRRRHPEWQERMVRLEAARRWLTPTDHARLFASVSGASE